MSPETRTIDRRFLGVRIHRRAPSAKVKTAYIRMLESLEEQGQLAVIESIRDDRLTLEKAYEAHKTGTFGTLITVDEVIPAIDALTDWLDASSKSVATKKSYKQHIALLLKRKPNATIDQLPALVAEYRAVAEKKMAVTTFRIVRAVALSYASDTYNKHSPMWTAIAGIKLLKKRPGTKTKHEGQARSVVDVVRVVKAMKAPYGKYFWQMCITGMGTAEFFSYPWEVLPDGVHIHGQKNDWRDRISLLVEPLETPEHKEQRCKIWLKKIEPTWQLTDGRRSFQFWCEDAGINQTRVDIYAGHKPQTMQQVYAEHDTAPYRVKDAQILRDYIKSKVQEAKGAKPEPPKPVEALFSTLD